MNWYRKYAQYAIQEPKNFYDIGHKSFNDKWGPMDKQQYNSRAEPKFYGEKLWLWDSFNNELLVKDAIGDITYDSAFRGKVPSLRGAYSGRFDMHNGKRLSVISPTPVSEPIPDDLMNALYREFGDDIKIYRFSD